MSGRVCVFALCACFALVACGLVSVSGAAPAQGASAPAGAWKHPGVTVTSDQIVFLQSQYAKKANPQQAAFNVALNSYQVTRPPGAVSSLNCANSGGNYANCQALEFSGQHAYINAVAFAATGATSYRDSAMAHVRAWGSTLTSSSFVHNSDTWLIGATSGVSWARAVEVLRWTANTGWTSADTATWTNLLRSMWIGLLRPTSASDFSNSLQINNWDTLATEAFISIAVFLEDAELFNYALARWRGNSPTYIYIAADGAVPRNPINPTLAETSTLRRLSCGYLFRMWDSNCEKNYAATIVPPQKFYSGQSMETCRDWSHQEQGANAIYGTAEVAWNQGVDLYGEQKDRLLAHLEFVGNSINKAATNADLNALYPNMCSGSTVQQPPTLSKTLGYEIAGNHFVGRLGLGAQLPQFKAFIAKVRAAGGATGDQATWGETYTHGDWALITAAAAPPPPPPVPPPTADSIQVLAASAYATVVGRTMTLRFQVGVTHAQSKLFVRLLKLDGSVSYAESLVTIGNTAAQWQNISVTLTLAQTFAAGTVHYSASIVVAPNYDYASHTAVVRFDPIAAAAATSGDASTPMLPLLPQAVASVTVSAVGDFTSVDSVTDDIAASVGINPLRVQLVSSTVAPAQVSSTDATSGTTTVSTESVTTLELAFLPPAADTDFDAQYNSTVARDIFLSLFNAQPQQEAIGDGVYATVPAQPLVVSGAPFVPARFSDSSRSATSTSDTTQQCPNGLVQAECSPQDSQSLPAAGSTDDTQKEDSGSGEVGAASKGAATGAAIVLAAMAAMQMAMSA